MNNLLFYKKMRWIAVFALLWQTTLRAQESGFPPLDTLPALDSLPGFVLQDYARHLAGQAAGIRDVYARLAEESIQEREQAAAQLDTVKSDTTVSKDDRKSLEKTLKSAKNAEKSAQSQLQKANKAAAFAEKIMEMDSAALRKNLPKAYNNLAALLPKPEEKPIADVIGQAAVATPADTVALIAPPPADTAAIAETPPAEPEPPEEPKAKKEKKEKKQPPVSPVFKSYDPARDVMLNPPPRPCRLTVDSRDEFSGELRRENAAEELFRYTNPSLKPYFADREHVLCQAALTANSGAYVMHLVFTVNDVNAQRSFGGLARNGVAILKFLDGETLTLYNLRADEGQPENNKQAYSFHGQYSVEPGMLKKMQKTLLDKVRIGWSTGYEDYEIQNVDAFIRQSACLTN